MWTRRDHQVLRFPGQHRKARNSKQVRLDGTNEVRSLCARHINQKTTSGPPTRLLLGSRHPTTASQVLSTVSGQIGP
jgi:hypothetical protein